jgi:phage shock protein PspC (stress-responsive transcriptional regulator)
MANQGFYRDPERKLIAGICGALAPRFGIDATVLRLAVALIALFTGGTIIAAYVIVWMITPLGTAGRAPLARWIERAGDLFRSSDTPKNDWPDRV